MLSIFFICRLRRFLKILWNISGCSVHSSPQWSCSSVCKIHSQLLVSLLKASGFSLFLYCFPLLQAFACFLNYISLRLSTMKFLYHIFFPVKIQCKIWNLFFMNFEGINISWHSRFKDTVQSSPKYSWQTYKICKD